MTGGVTLHDILKHVQKNAQFLHRSQNRVTKTFCVGSAKFTSDIELLPLHIVWR